jgi:hypothetical protein
MTNRRVVRGDVILQPWFLPRSATDAVMKLLPPHYLKKMRDCFDRFGCMKCERKGIIYGGNGLCVPCHRRFALRLRRCAKRRAKENEKDAVSNSLDQFTMNAQIARDLLSDLAPSIIKSKNPVRDLSGRRGRF